MKTKTEVGEKSYYSYKSSKKGMVVKCRVGSRKGAKDDGIHTIKYMYIKVKNKKAAKRANSQRTSLLNNALAGFNQGPGYMNQIVLFGGAGGE